MWRGHTGAILSLDFDDERLATGSEDCTVRLWDTDLEQDCFSLVQLQSAPTTLFLRPNGFVAGCRDGRLRYVGLEDGLELSGSLSRLEGSGSRRKKSSFLSFSTEKNVH